MAKEDVGQSMMEKPILCDKGSADRYDTISAFVKSLRRLDPDAALYWMAEMLLAGEDPKLIAQRMVTFASEDMSNAGSMALVLATSIFRTMEVIGLPECRINLGQCVSYSACAKKSNRVYQGTNAAMDFVKSHPAAGISMCLRDPYNPRAQREKGEAYGYPHQYQDGFAQQDYPPEGFQDLVSYKPSDRGYEKGTQKRRTRRWEGKKDWEE